MLNCDRKTAEKARRAIELLRRSGMSYPAISELTTVTYRTIQNLHVGATKTIRKTAANDLIAMADSLSYYGSVEDDGLMNISKKELYKLDALRRIGLDAEYRLLELSDCVDNVTIIDVADIVKEATTDFFLEAYREELSEIVSRICMNNYIRSMGNDMKDNKMLEIITGAIDRMVETVMENLGA